MVARNGSMMRNLEKIRSRIAASGGDNGAPASPWIAMLFDVRPQKDIQTSDLEPYSNRKIVWLEIWNAKRLARPQRWIEGRNRP
jgi:hypothetical protein